jgi:hypothetical protein
MLFVSEDGNVASVTTTRAFEIRQGLIVATCRTAFIDPRGSRVWSGLW